MRLFAMLLLLHVISPAHADLAPSIVPVVAIEGEPIHLRLGLPGEDCYLAEGFNVMREGSKVTVKIFETDGVLPQCPPQWVPPVMLPLGAMPAGSYQVEVVTCANAPPLDYCDLRATLTLQIISAADVAHVVPTLSPLGVAVLAFAVGLLAVLMRGRR